jgi:hypothetical protein
VVRQWRRVLRLGWLALAGDRDPESRRASRRAALNLEACVTIIHDSPTGRVRRYRGTDDAQSMILRT